MSRISRLFRPCTNHTNAEEESPSLIGTDLDWVEKKLKQVSTPSSRLRQLVGIYYYLDRTRLVRAGIKVPTTSIGYFDYTLTVSRLD